MSFRFLPCAPFVLGLAFCGCGEDTPLDADAGADDGDGYPEGPYGEGDPLVGDVIENVALQGFFNEQGGNPTEQPFEAFNMQRFRETAATHALVVTAMAWCPSCQTAASELGSVLEAETLEALEEGGIVIELLLQNTTTATPTEPNIRTWSDTYELDVNVVGPAEPRTAEVFAFREFAYVIELETMKVVFNSGNQIFADPTVSRVGLDGLRAAVGLGATVPPIPEPPIVPTPEPPMVDDAGMADAGIPDAATADPAGPDAGAPDAG